MKSSNQPSLECFEIWVSMQAWAVISEKYLEWHVCNVHCANMRMYLQCDATVYVFGGLGAHSTSTPHLSRFPVRPPVSYVFQRKVSLEHIFLNCNALQYSNICSWRRGRGREEGIAPSDPPQYYTPSISPHPLSPQEAGTSFLLPHGRWRDDSAPSQWVTPPAVRGARASS